MPNDSLTRHGFAKQNAVGPQCNLKKRSLNVGEFFKFPVDTFFWGIGIQSQWIPSNSSGLLKGDVFLTVNFLLAVNTGCVFQIDHLFLTEKRVGLPLSMAFSSAVFRVSGVSHFAGFSAEALDRKPTMKANGMEENRCFGRRKTAFFLR